MKMVDRDLVPLGTPGLGTNELFLLIGTLTLYLNQDMY